MHEAEPNRRSASTQCSRLRSALPSGPARLSEREPGGRGECSPASHPFGCGVSPRRSVSNWATPPRVASGRGKATREITGRSPSSWHGASRATSTRRLGSLRRSRGSNRSWPSSRVARFRLRSRAGSRRCRGFCSSSARRPRPGSWARWRAAFLAPGTDSKSVVPPAVCGARTEPYSPRRSCSGTTAAAPFELVLLVAAAASSSVRFSC